MRKADAADVIERPSTVLTDPHEVRQSGDVAARQDQQAAHDIFGGQLCVSPVRLRHHA
jgi:hypothetical protein